MKIFISHKQVDSAAIAEKLFYSLEKQGHTPWLDVNMPDRSVVGMEKGVKEANFCIAIISENYFSAKFCLSELQWAQEYGVPVVPVLNMDDKKRVSEFMNICPGDFKVIPPSPGPPTPRPPSRTSAGSVLHADRYLPRLRRA